MAFENKEVKEINLIIDKDDVMIKELVAGIWKDKIRDFSGFSYNTSLKIDAAFALDKRKNPIKTKVHSNKHKIEVHFPRPFRSGEKYVYELQLLLNPEVIRSIGGINIIDWPKEDLGEIHFLRNTGEIFFSSALAQIKYDRKRKIRSVTPSVHSKNLVSHSHDASAIRIEWGTSPKYKLRFDYTIENKGEHKVSDFTLSSYIPPQTKFQQVNVKIPKNCMIEEDEDENQLIKFKLGDLQKRKKTHITFFVEVTPQGNVGVMEPNFGQVKQYEQITKSGSIGESLLNSSSYWNTNEKEIKNLVNVLNNNSNNISEYIILAFEFVNQKINYRINNKRIDALNTYRQRSGDCSEMSDLFVTLLRANGIPAKIVHGWTLDFHNGNINLDLTNQGHAWCEFFAPSSKGWIQCDPTWGFLTGVSSQHICRQREGLIPEQNTYSWNYRGNSKVNVEEKVTLQIQ